MLFKMLKRIANNSNPQSYSMKLRKHRFGIFLKQLKDFNNNNINILDIGGTYSFWKLLDCDLDKRYKLTILNKKFKVKKRLT